MIFEGANCALGGIASMQMRGHKLEVDGFGVHEGFQSGRAFVVKLLQLWTEPARDQQGMDALVRGDELGGGAILHWLGEDGVRVDVVNNHQVLVARG